MTFRLRHRASFPLPAVSHALQLRVPRATAPPEWSWTWPLSTASHGSAPAAPADAAPPPPPWVSAVRAVAVADDAAHVAFVSNDHGRVALVSFNNPVSCAPLLLAVDGKPAVATSVCFLELALPGGRTPGSYVCVGYATGHVAFFSVHTREPLVVTRPSPNLAVRRLRLYPSLQLARGAPVYPFPSENAAIVAVLGWGGAVVHFPLSELAPILQRTDLPYIDLRGAGWTVWNTNVQRAVLDVAACSTDPSSICDLDLPPGDAPLRILCAGVAPALAAYSATNNPAFSARDVAKRAASSMLSVAKGFLFSRITGDPAASPPTEEEKAAITGAARFITSWGDDSPSTNPPLTLLDVRGSARKSVNAVLSRSRKSIDMNNASASVSFRSQPSRASSSSFNPDDQVPPVDIELDHSDSGKTLTPQRSRFAGEDIVIAAKLPQNARVVERIAAAPLPCSLLATSDTLGRIFVQDSRDLCVLRVLKGYRDADVAWVAQGGPLLAILAPRLNVLELHRPLDVKRIAAFRVPAGSMLVQSAMHHAFCISPHGHLYELMRSRKTSEVTARATETVPQSRDADDLKPPTSTTAQNGNEHMSVVEKSLSGSVVDYESLHVFLEAVKRSQTSDAVDCLQMVAENRQKVAHLMTAVVTCTSYIRPETHIALASKAAQIASNLNDRDLSSRFEAHSRLAEAYAMVFAEILPDDAAAEDSSVAKYGKQLMEDDIGAGLLEFAVEAMQANASPNKANGKRIRPSKHEENIFTCERFILSHALHPSADVRSSTEYILRPRRDLSEPEQTWLAKLYFSRLLHVDPADLPTEGREHPATKDVFFALSDVIGLQETELAHHFALFFLHVPLLSLLKTHVATHASPIRCAISRLRMRFSQEVVDQVLMEECETTTCIPNAVLLTRLCVIHERRRSDGNAALFLQSLDRLEEVLLFRKLIAGSKVPKTVYEKFTARGCTGTPGDAERHAVTCLIEWNEFDRTSKILTCLDESRQIHRLAWQEAASVSEAALLACRKKAVHLISSAGREVIPENVFSWILAVDVEEDQSDWMQLVSGQKETVLRQIRSVLLSAHQYFSDSSVNVVRCLQLAEAMSALIELEATGGTQSEAPAVEMTETPDHGRTKGLEMLAAVTSEDHENRGGFSDVVRVVDGMPLSFPIDNAGSSDEQRNVAKDGPLCKLEPSSRTDHEEQKQAVKLSFQRDGKLESVIGGPTEVSTATAPKQSFAIPTLETSGLDDDAVDPVPTLPGMSSEIELAPSGLTEPSESLIAAEVDNEAAGEAESSHTDEDDEMFFDASSRHASESFAANGQDESNMT